MRRHYICAPPCPTLNGWNVVVSSASKDCSRPSAITSKVCSYLTCNAQVETSVCIIQGCRPSVKKESGNSPKKLAIVK